MALNLDLADPAVQELMTGTDKRATVQMPGSTKQATMTHLAGDEEHGFASTQYLNRGKQEIAVLFRPKNTVTMIAGVLTVDVYALPDEPVKLHLICPKCRHTLTVDANRKAIEWDPKSSSPVSRAVCGVLPPASLYLAANLGVLSVAEFGCTWELEDDKQDNGDANVIASGSLCRFRGVIEKNVLREV